MLGVFVTILAVLLVICIAFHFSDPGIRSDSVIFVRRKGPKRYSE
jgi:hypothetical protein